MNETSIYELTTRFISSDQLAWHLAIGHVVVHAEVFPPKVRRAMAPRRATRFSRWRQRLKGWILLAI